MKSYDFIIVGAGSAGCVLADRLSADPQVNVLLIEAGRDYHRKETSIPAAWPKLFKSECDWAYQAEPDPGLNGRGLFVPRGKGLGGTSIMNAMMYQRGNRADFDEWAALGNAGWSYDDVLPYFKRSEDNQRGDSEHHGTSGPLAVTDVREPNALSLAFLKAAEQAGIARTRDHNGATQDGVAFTQVNIRNGKRCSAADAFLRPALERTNLDVITDSHATRILIEHGRAIGVRYRRAGREETARTDGEIVISAGALDSPKLLMLSGVGPADTLTAHGIDVVHDLPGVGQNLQEHTGGKLMYRSSVPVSLFSAESPGNLARYLLFRRGMLACNGPEAVAFVRTNSSLDAPDVEILLLPALWLNEGFTPPPEHGYTIAVVLLKPRSRGSVTLRSANPLDPPRISMRLFSDPEGNDMRTVLEGMRIARRIVSAPALAALTTEEIVPGAGVTSDEELAESVRAEAQTIWHPCGTCRMGTNEMSVVDANLRVHGVEGLRVIDVSVMPTITRGHTHAPAVMIGEKGSDLLLEHHESAPARTSIAV